MSFFDSENWTVVYRNSFPSTTGKYQLVVEEKRLKYTEVLMRRGQLIRNGTPVADIDILRDPRKFWCQWIGVKKEQHSFDESAHTPNPGPVLRQPVTSPPMPGGAVPRRYNMQETDEKSQEITIDEYLICQGVRPGAVLFSMKDAKSYTIDTNYEWKYATLSPDGRKLAITCDEESSQPIRVFDFTHPSRVPYYEYKLENIKLEKGMKIYQSTISWKDNKTLKANVPTYGKDAISMGYNMYNQPIYITVKDVSTSSQMHLSQSVS
jgi:hypothetical protein